jgi:hypothetical protein
MKIKDIQLNKQTQSRVSINQDVVTEYADEILNGTVFPNITAFFDGIHYYLVDGYHRYFAYKKAGVEDVSVDVLNGTLRDAVLYAVGVNSDHGLRRTPDDRRKAVMTLLDDMEWAEWSDRVIAKHCNVSAMTVGRIRKSLNLEQTEKKYINKQGNETVIKTDNIGRKAEEPAHDPREDHIQELATANVELAEELTALKDRLAVKALDVTPEEKEQYQSTVEELRAQIKTLEAENNALKSSRDQLLSKNADMLKQISYWKKRAERVAA